MVCSKCGKKMWIWEEKKINGQIYCESCYNEIDDNSNIKDNAFNEDDNLDGKILWDHIYEPNVPHNSYYTPTDNDIELGFQIALKESTKKILFGILWFFGGLIATILNPFFLFWGAIIFGFYDLIIGIYRYIDFKNKLKKFLVAKSCGQIIDLNNYRIENIIYENLSKIARDAIIKEKKIIQSVLIISILISILLIATLFTGNGIFLSQQNIFDEDFILNGDGSIPTDDTLIEYMSYELETEGDVEIFVNLSIDNMKKVDLFFHEEKGIYFEFGDQGELIENVSSYSGSFKTTTLAKQIVYVEVWNSNNYEEVKGHITIS